MFTQDQLNILDDAIAQGALIVKYADKEVEYRSLLEMMQVRDLMMKELNPSGNVEPRGRKYAQFSNGLLPNGNSNCY
jgi:hypothetical protein